MPTCKSEAADYFFVNGGRLPAFDVSAVANLLRNGNGITRIYVTGDKSEFIAALTAHISEVAAELGYTGGFQYGYENLGREFILIRYAKWCHSERQYSVPLEMKRTVLQQSCSKDGETVTAAHG